jgi:hypothetical protein
LITSCSRDGISLPDDGPQNNDNNNAVYLDENGITVKAKDWAEIGDTGIINNIQYTIVDKLII